MSDGRLESERHAPLYGEGRVGRKTRARKPEPKGLMMASRDVPAFPREERHHREPAGTRQIGGTENSDRATGYRGEEEREISVSFRTRSEISRDYPLNLSISLSGGKETNQDSPSNGE